MPTHDSTADLSPFHIPGILHIEESPAGYPMIRIQNEHAEASIALHGAHLTHYAPNREKAVIFTSEAAIYKQGKAIRGGIPVCWPWFGAHPDPAAGLPAHGYARSQFWQIIDSEHDASGTAITLELPSPDKPGLSATLRFHVGKQLQLELTSRNQGDSEATFSEALHSYFAVGNSQSCWISGLNGAEYIDTTGKEEVISQQSGKLRFPDEVDRIYQSSQSLTIHDPVIDRRIIVTKSNSANTIAWNPGKEKGHALGDLLDSEIQRFVCVESGNVRQQHMTLSAGSSHTLTLNIATES